MSDGLNTYDWSDLNTTAHLDDLPLGRKIRHILNGLSAPTCPGHRKWALFQIKRSRAGILALIVPILAALLVSYIAGREPKELEAHIPIRVMPDEVKPDLEPLKEIKKLEEPIDTKLSESLDRTLTDALISESASKENYDKLLPDLAVTDTPQINETALLNTPSPIRFRVPMKSGPRGSNRKQALLNHNAPPGSESSVLLALRWLKKNQHEDGTWGKTKPAVTSLALLTYLAHNETPESAEFGTTVESALRWLLENQKEDGRFNGSDSHEYSLPIAAYALAEAFSMTKIPDIRYAAEKAIEIIVKGQHAEGGWDYNCKASQRNDTSYAGWCIQALKAAKVASLNVDGLEDAVKRAADGLKMNYQGNSEYGGFGYTGKSQTHGLTSVGVLCLQILADSEATEVTSGLNTLGTDKFKFDLLNPRCGKNGLYYWYYITQAMFHAGGAQWDSWNADFSRDLVSEQKVMAEDQSGYVDHKGIPRAIGYWDQYEGHGASEGTEFPTVLCALQLEVYYRYLPSYQDAVEVLPQDIPPQIDNGINIQIVL